MSEAEQQRNQGGRIVTISGRRFWRPNDYEAQTTRLAERLRATYDDDLDDATADRERLAVMREVAALRATVRAL